MDISSSKKFKYPQSSCITLVPAHSPRHVSCSKEGNRVTALVGSSSTGTMGRRSPLPLGDIYGQLCGWQDCCRVEVKSYMESPYRPECISEHSLSPV